MADKKKPVDDMSLPAQLGEIAGHLAGGLRRKLSKGKPTRQGRSYDDIEAEANGLRRKRQSSDW